jgi:hypothetical protein
MGDALRRALAPDGPTGSHLAGIFIRAGKECEREIAKFMATELCLSVRRKAPVWQVQHAMSDLLSTTIGRTYWLYRQLSPT